MWTATTIEQMRSHRRKFVGEVALVPTMGALHAGHMSLVRIAQRLTSQVVVSIFVNPTQFGPHEDFHKYPRPADHDLAQCKAAGVTGVFMPPPEEMYPPGRPACEVHVPELAAELEGALRPGHFAGVCRVVAKLFQIVQPELACFGRKDYQQLRIVQAMVTDLDMPVKVVECPTMREADGLAMSSRNAYLSPEDRKKATGIHEALQAARTLVEKNGQTDPRVVEARMKEVLAQHGIAVDYAELRHPTRLSHLAIIDASQTGGVVALIAGRLGKTRLIDNMLLGARERH